ncbi:hypothetical protein [Mumia zhuanghuii]|uniref:hypothetical protein n=1 Tax=Mumia zhuanghuii TaxID=2585211 RepID=UPI003639C141
MENEDDSTQWTPVALSVYGAKAAELVAVLQEHVTSNSARRGHEREVGDYFRSTDRLRDALREFADAEFDWCGSAPLYLDEWVDDDDFADEEVGADGPIMSVFGRHDVVVHDDGAVVTAGREAYMRAWPNEEAEDARVRVADVRSAVFEVIHADGVSALSGLPGMELARDWITCRFHDGDDDFDGNPFELVASGE